MARNPCPIDFLIIGAMKAGTTTLYRDLIRHPDISMPEQKEPESLIRFESMGAIRRDYERLFAKSKPYAIRGEASTAYAKRPIHAGVAEKAFALTNGNLRIVFMRRDPVERIISHYKHERQLKNITIPISEAIRQIPDFINFSRYDWQIAPWKECFGSDNVFEVYLENYAVNRLRVVREIVCHLGADPDRLPILDSSVVFNSADEPKYFKSPSLRAFILSSLYQRSIKPLFPEKVRSYARRKILGQPDVVHADISQGDRQFILDKIACYDGLDADR